MLTISQFGNPILRQKAEPIAISRIQNKEVQVLISDMRELLLSKKLGVGLAAPQVGQGIALAVIAIRPNKYRPNREFVDLVIINPEIISTYGYRQQLYEGCISGGPGKAGIFAKVPRHKKLRIVYYDENGQRCDKVFEGLTAHVIQHEIDHLQGVLFVDRVKDTTSYMTHREYLKIVKTDTVMRGMMGRTT